MPTLESIVRDVYSKLGLQGEQHEIYKDDIVKTINDVIRQQRIEYIQNGLGTQFATTETLTSLTEDSNYSFLNSDTLSNELIDEIPEFMAILASTAFPTTNALSNSSQSWSEGDIAIKDGTNTVYEALEDITSTNTFDLTFDVRDARPYFRGNGLTYNQGEIVWDRESGDYFKVNTTFTADQDVVATSVSELDKLKWKKLGAANKYVSHYPFSNVQTMRVFDSLEDVEAFTINKDTVYASPSIKKLVLSYIPKWTDITTFSADVDIPDFMINNVKRETVRTLAQKLGIQAELQQPKTIKEEDNE